ncbi:hypothetical protein HFO45_11380 [Rhizobium leguminosarum]|uniref:hypothetical protein n=1 Tax=Rhizobium leguminosarum TaxID=384 RepID=UPI001C980686|nr:hypothetical protein [Rhizobium leguminosarum]MBY5648855.1 hypothetical protein [Rhizobium leguminosarum]
MPIAMPLSIMAHWAMMLVLVNRIAGFEIGKLPRVQKPRDVAAERVAGQIVQRLGKTVSPEIVTGGGVSPAL